MKHFSLVLLSLLALILLAEAGYIWCYCLHNGFYVNTPTLEVCDSITGTERMNDPGEEFCYLGDSEAKMRRFYRQPDTRSNQLSHMSDHDAKRKAGNGVLIYAGQHPNWLGYDSLHALEKNPNYKEIYFRSKLYYLDLSRPSALLKLTSFKAKVKLVFAINPKLKT
ncbi:uncharacterized protein LY79DRAFT_584790 [Colletotrichum navitas]|uniref:Uncharacterized protein n=1 Tax=Colletotrichum navitas TaxID=681940 RepID=A0AAD8UYV9_9PEZI|nr:uncharacterized protein LY79DRAFT_584790 [Colletotrichum navitas]KAK1566435.1 hypothetical protein LY79DRAFT_584790 [Colletotrichum navitas]